MSDPSLLDAGRLHANAVLALLRAGLSYVVYLAEITTADDQLTYPYLVLYPDAGVASLNSLAAATADFDFGWQITAVGRDFAETQAATDRARMVLLGARPTVAGRSCGLVTQPPGGAQQVQRDPSARDPATGRPVWYATAQYQAMSVPA